MTGIETLVRRADQKLGRLVFGNTAGFRNNAGGARRLGRARSSGGDPPAGGPYAALRDEHCHVFSDPADASGVSDRFDALIDDPERSLGRGSKGARSRDIVFSRILRDATDLFPEARLLLDAPLQDALGAYFGGFYRIRDVLAWRNYHFDPQDVGGREVYSDHWHCDEIPTDIIKYFVVLKETTPEHGPFLFRTRTGTREALRRGYVSRKSYGLPAGDLDDGPHVGRLVGPAGARALCNTAICLHRASVPARGLVRDIVQIQFQASDRPFDPATALPADRPDLDRIYGGSRRAEAAP